MNRFITRPSPTLLNESKWPEYSKERYVFQTLIRGIVRAANLRGELHSFEVITLDIVSLGMLNVKDICINAGTTEFLTRFSVNCSIETNLFIFRTVSEISRYF